MRALSVVLLLFADLSMPVVWAAADIINGPIELSQAISDRIERVPEFRFIEQEAQKLGAHVYLFGGTAAAYAHYVKWDLQREKKDPRFQPDRFDYDYTNIFRSTQDLDIVIDGTAEQAKKLQDVLAQEFPHLQGSKSAWEVTLLKEDMGEKPSKFSPDFQNQHNDSNSTGLIEITSPKAGEPRIRDVRDWNSKTPYFLRDVAEGKLHYYFSQLHETTRFFREGRNPPIFSAIRALTKAFQYEVELRPEDWKKIHEIIDHFNPERDLKSDYAKTWIEKNGKKLIQNAINIEFAVGKMDELGLRKKLATIRGDEKHSDSLAWWMHKEPLRTQAVGTGTGKTARELGLDIVSHETNNFLAYESITRAHTGDANVLTSRDGIKGENAAYGNGFYTRSGRSGAAGTGLTIRFHLDPNAREGTDFIRPENLDYVVIKNKAAIRVIPESLKMNLLSYFQFLADGGEVSTDDRALIEKLKRRIGRDLEQNSENSDIGKVLQIVKNAIHDASDNSNSRVILKDWFSLSLSHRYPEVALEYLHSGKPAHVVRELLKQKFWQDQPEIHHYLIQSGALKRWIAEGDQHFLEALKIPTQPYALDPAFRSTILNDPDMVDTFLRPGQEVGQGQFAFMMIEQSLFTEDNTHIDILEKLIHAAMRSDYFRPIVYESHLDSLLSLEEWENQPYLKWLCPERVNYKCLKSAIQKHSSLAQTNTEFELMQKFKSGAGSQTKIEALIEKDLHETLGHSRPLSPIVADWFSLPASAHRPDFVESLLRSNRHEDVIRYVLSQPHWNQHPEFIRQVIDRDWNEGITKYRILETLGMEQWSSHPELVTKAIRKGEVSHALDNFDGMVQKEILNKPYWKNNPKLRAMAHGQDPTAANLRGSRISCEAAFDELK